MNTLTVYAARLGLLGLAAVPIVFAATSCGSGAMLRVHEQAAPVAAPLPSAPNRTTDPQRIAQIGHGSAARYVVCTDDCPVPTVKTRWLSDSAASPSTPRWAAAPAPEADPAATATATPSRTAASLSPAQAEQLAAVRAAVTAAADIATTPDATPASAAPGWIERAGQKVAMAARSILPDATRSAAATVAADPAMRASQAWREIGSTSVVFSTAEARLTPQAQRQLDALMKRADQAQRITVAGRTDDRGSAAENFRVAQLRATEVSGYLSRTYPQHAPLLDVEARGACCYVAPNTSAAGRLRNRRVEVVLSVREDL